MCIESIELRNYQLFRHAELKDLQRLLSSLVPMAQANQRFLMCSVFLKEALAQNVVSAVKRRGGFRELVSRGEAGPIGITLKFRKQRTVGDISTEDRRG